MVGKSAAISQGPPGRATLTSFSHCRQCGTLLLQAFANVPHERAWEGLSGPCPCSFCSGTQYHDNLLQGIQITAPPKRALCPQLEGQGLPSQSSAAFCQNVFEAGLPCSPSLPGGELSAGLSDLNHRSLCSQRTWTQPSSTFSADFRLFLFRLQCHGHGHSEDGMSVLLQTRPCVTSRQGGALCVLTQQLLAKVGVGADAGYA